MIHRITLGIWLYRVIVLVVADESDLTVYNVSRVQGAWYLDISADSHDFGDTLIDSTAECQFTVRNHSVLERTLDTVEVEGGVFACPFDSAVTLQANEEVVLTVFFTPLADSVYIGRLVINSGDDVLEVQLQGRGIPPDDLKEPPEVVREFSLHTYPNPFNNQTTFVFNLPGEQTVSLHIYDLSGREVAKVLDGRRKAGTYQAVWDATGVPSGVYLYRFEAGSFVKASKLVLVR